MQKETKDVVVAMGSSFLAGVVTTLLVLVVALFIVKSCPKKDFPAPLQKMPNLEQKGEFRHHNLGDQFQMQTPKGHGLEAPLPPLNPSEEHK